MTKVPDDELQWMSSQEGGDVLPRAAAEIRGLRECLARAEEALRESEALCEELCSGIRKAIENLAHPRAVGRLRWNRTEPALAPIQPAPAVDDDDRPARHADPERIDETVREALAAAPAPPPAAQREGPIDVDFGAPVIGSVDEEREWLQERMFCETTFGGSPDGLIESVLNRYVRRAALNAAPQPERFVEALAEIVTDDDFVEALREAGEIPDDDAQPERDGGEVERLGEEWQKHVNRIIAEDDAKLDQLRAALEEKTAELTQTHQLLNNATRLADTAGDLRTALAEKTAECERLTGELTIAYRQQEGQMKLTQQRAEECDSLRAEITRLQAENALLAQHRDNARAGELAALGRNMELSSRLRSGLKIGAVLGQRPDGTLERLQIDRTSYAEGLTDVYVRLQAAATASNVNPPQPRPNFEFDPDDAATPEAGVWDRELRKKLERIARHCMPSQDVSLEYLRSVIVDLDAARKARSEGE